MTDDRAVSDALGFVLVFAIIVSTVAVVYVGGFQSLDNARQFERMNNAERAYEVFADNVEDITQRGAPSRATEIKLSEASLYAGAEEQIKVNVTRHNDGSLNNSAINHSYNPLVYQSRTEPSNEMAYELGATLRSSQGGTTMSEEPAWVIGKDRVVIPIILVYPPANDNVNVTGSRTAQVTTKVQDRSILVTNTTHSSDVFVTMNTSRPEPWRTYLERKGMTCPDGENFGERVHCELTDVDTVYVTVIRIEYEIE